MTDWLSHARIGSSKPTTASFVLGRRQRNDQNNQLQGQNEEADNYGGYNETSP